MNELALFAGAGGGILGGKLLGWRTVCAVEYDNYAASVLVARQNDGCLEPFPVWDDVRTFDGVPWRGRIDVVSGGFPCQDISLAGIGEGIDGQKSGLWREMARVIREVLPRYVYVENSPALTSRGLYRVLGDLAEMGFDAQWGVLGADDVGANHRRKRIWVVARSSGCENASDANGKSRKERDLFSDGGVKTSQRDNSSRFGFQGWWKVKPDVGLVVDGMAHRLDRLKCLGNGQVPAVAATAFKMLKERGQVGT